MGAASSNLRTVRHCYSAMVRGARSFLPRSACRHTVRTVSSAFSMAFYKKRSGVQSLRILGARAPSFLLIIRTSRLVTSSERSSGRYSDFPAYSQIFFRNYNGQLIVTAAVYRGFDSKLRVSYPTLTSPLNLPAPGRRQTLYVVFDFAESCVFSKQSPGPFLCDLLGLRKQVPSP